MNANELELVRRANSREELKNLLIEAVSNDKTLSEKEKKDKIAAIIKAAD